MLGAHMHGIRIERGIDSPHFGHRAFHSGRRNTISYGPIGPFLRLFPAVGTLGHAAWSYPFLNKIEKRWLV